jgi:hypothetical protein
MARPVLPEMSPWKRQALTIPPDSWRAWLRLAAWEFWIGMLMSGALGLGVRLIVTAPDNIITAFDFTNCYAAPPIAHPCERVAYRTGELSVALNIWCGVLLLVVAALLLWELWNAVAPKPITDDFLKLLDDSFGRDWRRPRTWPWARIGWAYGFTLVGATAVFGIALVVSNAISSSAKAPTARVETSQQFRHAP